MHGLRPEYQDRINFVILDYDNDDDLRLARDLGVAQHPAYAVLPPDGGPDDVSGRRFGPVPETELRRVLDSALAQFAR